MQYTLFEIRSYKQLERCSPDIVKEVHSIVSINMDSQGIRINPKSPGYFLFQFPSSRLADLELMAAAVNKAYAQLEEMRHDLMGFSILIDADDSQDDMSIFRSLRNRLLQVNHDDSFWIGDSARHNFEHLFLFHENIDTIAGLNRVDTIKKSNHKDIGFQQYSIDQEILDALYSALESYYTPDYRAAIRWIQTSYPLETISTIESCAKKFFKLGFQDCYLSLRIITDPPYIIWGEEHIDVFSKVLREQILNEPANPVCFAEQPMYRIRQHIYNCLEERIEAAEYTGKPLVLAVFCEDKIDEKSNQILSWISETMLRRGIGIPIIISKEEAKALPHLPKEACTVLDHHRLKNQSMLRKYWESTGSKNFAEIAADCDSRSQIVLFSYFLFRHSISSEMLLEFLQKEGISPFIFPEISQQLADKGLIASTRFPVPLIDEQQTLSFPWISKNESTRLMQRAELFIQANIDASRLQITVDLLRVGTIIADPHRVLNWFLSLSQQLLWSKRIEEAGKLIRHAHQVLCLTFSRGIAVRIRWVLWTCRMLLALEENDKDAIRNLRSDVQDFSLLSGLSSADSGYVLLAVAKMNQSLRNWNSALQYAKKAIISFQEAHERTGIIEANTLIARCRLIQGSMWEALDYMQIATDFASPIKNAIIYAHTAALMAAKQFLYGNYSRAREICLAINPLCQDSGWTQLSLKLQFMIARVDFELGCYDTAMQKFGAGSAFSRSLESPHSLAMFLRWQIRCLSYTNAAASSIHKFREQAQHPERDLFLGEALLMYEEYSLAQTVLQNAEEQWHELLSETNTHLFTTGFSIIEGTGIFYDSEYSYPPLLLGRCYSAAAEIQKQCSKDALEHMQSLVRSNNISPIDPSAAIYYYLYAQGLLMADEPIEDPNAIIGKAAKQLQERSTKMDNPKDKIAFLKKNYWSRRLLDTAQAQKMV